MLAPEFNRRPSEFGHYLQQSHIYVNHIDGAKEQIMRKPREKPKLVIAKKPFWELTFEDFKLENYNPEPPIKFTIAV